MIQRRLFVLRLVLGLVLLATPGPVDAQRLTDLPRFPSTTGEPGPELSLEGTELLGAPGAKLQLRSPVPPALSEATSPQVRDVDLASGILGAALGTVAGWLAGAMLGSSFCDSGCGRRALTAAEIGAIIGGGAGFYHFGTAHWVDPEPEPDCECEEEEEGGR